MKELTKKFNSLIPGGAHTYSKGHDQFPANAPAAIVSGSGAWVFDDVGQKFIDCAMGLTSVSIGHGNEHVARAVYDAALNGTNFSKPAVLELVAAEFFLENVAPHHDMVKFTKNGSTATTAALKLARAYTGREKVLVPKEFPFFSYDDWFIAGTLARHGTQISARNQILKFSYGDMQDLERVILENKNDIAALITEPVKFDMPYEGYLKDVKEICKKYGIVFVLDEMWCGAKIALGGGQEYFGVEADLATWGKGIANGYSCCALTGKRAIMELGGIMNEGQEKVFLVSTTHGAESTGLAAMMSTISVLTDKSILLEGMKIGELFFKSCEKLIKKHDLTKNFKVKGDTRVVQTIEIAGNSQFDSAELATYFYQEIIRNQVLYNGLFYFSAAHREPELEFMLQALDKALASVSSSLHDGKLDFSGNKIKPVFRRLV